MTMCEHSVSRDQQIEAETQGSCGGWRFAASESATTQALRAWGRLHLALGVIRSRARFVLEATRGGASDQRRGARLIDRCGGAPPLRRAQHAPALYPNVACAWRTRGQFVQLEVDDMEQQSISAGQAQAKVDGALDAAVKRFNDSFNHLDAKEFASCWAENGTVLNPFGNFGKGREGVERVFHEDAERFMEGATTTVRIVGARSISEDCIYLDLDHDVQNYKGPDATGRPVRLHVAIVAQKRGDEWKWLDVRAYFIRDRPQPMH